MSHGCVRFRQREASRAIRAAEQAGLTVEKIEVSAEGRLSLVTSRGKQTEAAPINEWDRDLDDPTPVPLRS
jgi:hypothetical protein